MQYLFIYVKSRMHVEWKQFYQYHFMSVWCISWLIYQAIFNKNLLFLVDGNWTSWIIPTNTCVQINDSNTWGILNYRNCSNPLPRYGGKECNSNIGFTEYLYDICTPGAILLLLKVKDCLRNRQLNKNLASKTHNLYCLIFIILGAIGGHNHFSNLPRKKAIQKFGTNFNLLTRNIKKM